MKSVTGRVCIARCAVGKNVREKKQLEYDGSNVPELRQENGLQVLEVLGTSTDGQTSPTST